MTTADKQKKLKDFESEADFRQFLIDLLKKIGFKDVQHTHRYGSPELGKDIIGRLPHPLDEDDWYSFVVKKGNIGGGTFEIETIKGQIKQSFEYPYKGLKGEKLKINKVKVITNENFTQGAQTSISNSPELNMISNIDYWWYENLIPLVDKYYPDFWLPGDAFSKEYSKSFSTDLQEEIEIRGLSLRKIDDKKLQKLLDIFIEPKLTTSEVVQDKKTNEKSVKTKRISVSSIKEITENIMISGEQGSGKTKVLNTMACNLANAEYITTYKQIPIKLKAPNLRDNNFNIEESIIEQIRKYSDQFYSDEIINEYKPLLFIDDFDLLKNSDKEEFFDHVKSYCDNHNSKFVLTYRKSEFDYDGDIKTFRLHNFNTKQVEAFISKFFQGSERAERFIKILKESGILSKLPTTPLTVTLLSLLYDENNFEIPATLSDIYSDFTHVLLGKLDVRNKHELLVFNVKNRLFSTLALKMLDSKEFEMEFSEFQEFINTFLSMRGYSVQSEEDLLELIDNSGLLYIDDHNRIGFKQQAFVEFFASLEIYHHKRESHYPTMVENFNDVVWQNTCIFYAGHSKELEGMIDDVIDKSPNENLKDWFINTGGMGYLSQALYQTTSEERKKLVYKSLDNLILSFHELKKETQFPGFFHEMPLPILATIINAWFNDNFKSITLTETLELAFKELEQEESIFENNFMLLMIATTLMNPYIGRDDCFARLIERKGFMDSPILPLVADIILNVGNIDKNILNEEQKKEIAKAKKKKRDYIRSVLKEPAYRFDDDFALMEKGES